MSSDGVARRAVLGGIAAVSTSGMARAQPAAPVVETTTGRLRGVPSAYGLAFRGVRYGVAERFQAPRPAPPVAGVVDATRLGPIAPQVPSPSHPLGRQDEDCLNLNLYTPAADARRRPVLVFFHGGGFASGSGADYDGSRWAAVEDAVIVTVSHRLGPLGFIDLGEPGALDDGAANAGVLDMIEALRWVRSNVGRFGGDPGCVTIFGHSGGGAKVSCLLASPVARGLFQRAIPMSGAVLRALTADQARGLTRDLMLRLGLSGAPADRLRQLPPAALFQAMVAMGSTGRPDATRLNFGPVVGGGVLPAHPCDPDWPATSLDVPVLVGGTHDETRPFYVTDPSFAGASVDQLRARLAPVLKADLGAAIDIDTAYARALPALSPQARFIRVTTDYMFARNGVVSAERKAALSAAPAYLYRFDWSSPGPNGQRMGAAHGVDVSLLFDTGAPNPLLDDTAERATMAARQRRLWTRFARTGDPNGGGAPAWPPYDSRRRPTMILSPEPRLALDPRPELRALYPLLPDFHP